MMRSMHKLLFLPLAAFLLAVLGCSSREGHALLERAESLLPIRHDSAEVYLDSIPHPDRLAEDSRALYGLLRTIVQNRQGKGIRSDSLIRGSYEYYREASRAGQTGNEVLLRRYAQSCYYMALFYKTCDSIKQCEDLFNQAANYSERCEDWHTCYLAHTLLGQMNSLGNPENAIQQSLKALDFYRKINNDVSNEVLILGKIAAAYMVSFEADSALAYYRAAYELAEQNHLMESQNYLCICMADIYCYLGEQEKGLNYAKKGIVATKEAGRASSLESLASCYIACDSLEQAKELLNSISCDSDYMMKYIILRDLSEIAVKQNNLDSLFIYVDSAYECLEKRCQKSEYVRNEYYQENLAKELEKERLQHQAKLDKWVAAFIISVLALIALIIYNVLRKRIAAERQRRLDALVTLRNELSRLLSERQEDKREIECQREIIQQNDHTLSVFQNYLLDRVCEISDSLTEDEEIKITDEVWKEIEKLLDCYGNGMVRKLRQQYPDLKEEDIQLCMLLRLKLNNAVISNIYNVSVAAVKKRKLRLKRNGFNVVDPSVSLEDIVDKL